MFDPFVVHKESLGCLWFNLVFETKIVKNLLDSEGYFEYEQKNNF